MGSKVGWCVLYRDDVNKKYMPHTRIRDLKYEAIAEFEFHRTMTYKELHKARHAKVVKVSQQEDRNE